MLDRASGRQPWQFDEDAAMSLTPPRGQTAFVIRTGPLETVGLLTFTINALSIEVATDASFAFDPGPTPQPGQMWDLNQTVALGHGHSIRVLKAEYPTPSRSDLPQHAGFSFEMDLVTGVTSVILIDREHPLLGGGGGVGGSLPGRFNAGFTYRAGLPQGSIQVDVKSFWISVRGHWEARWTLPPVQ
jgi:hypothetical protein